ncbi:hypothetical protein J3459_016516 [Metarhizium acridum]|nr:hypothetical protein J3459_016516 [Metarhizium acridum]
MDVDSRAEQQSDVFFQVWLRNLLENSPEQLAAKLACMHYPGTPTTDESRIVVRFTAIGRVTARAEKVEDEVAVMGYLAQHTAIPMPKVLGSGKCDLGPYIVMSYVDGKALGGYIRARSDTEYTLRPGLALSTLRTAYFAMAEVLLELSKPEFPFIGAVRKNSAGVWTVSKRPLTYNMNRLTQWSNIPHGVFEQQHFSNAADYFEELAQHHFYHLEYQRNDAVANEADCRKKYIARCLFRKLSREISKEYCNGPFRLFCDDLRPENVLVDASKLAIAGVVDWEFTYAGPVEFTHAAPWWLLLERPEVWESPLSEFLVRYMPKFRIFLEVLQDCEARKLRDGSLSESQRLSSAMEKSLETGLFWICLASRHSCMFDEIFWEFIDSKYFGPFTTIEDRLCLLNTEERTNIDSFIDRKMGEARDTSLVPHYSAEG